jgi:hypothetical protein
LRYAFYRLGVCEREAFNVEVKFGEKLNERLNGSIMASVDYMREQQKGMYNRFRDAYDCPKFSDEQINELIDAAQMNIFENRRPKDSREAAITYDFATLLYQQNRGWSYEEYQKMIDVKEKSLRLQEAGYLHANTIPMHNANTYTLDMVKQLDQITRDQNPKLMTMALCKYGNEIQSLVNKDSYDQWYFSENNTFKDVFLDQISDIMGPEYSSENRIIRMEEMALEQTEINLEDLVVVNDMKRIDLDEISINVDEIYLTKAANGPFDLDFGHLKAKSEFDLHEDVTLGEVGVELEF